MSLDFTLESLVSNTDDNVAPIATAAFFVYLANILINSRPRIRQKLEDYEGCGQYLTDPVPGFIGTPPDQCTWKCDWLDAPFLDSSFATATSRQDNPCAVSGLDGLNDCSASGENRLSVLKNTVVDMYFVYNLQKLPKDLKCLEGCGYIFEIFWKNSCKDDARYYNDINNVTLDDGTTVALTQANDKDAFYNCYMDKRKLRETDFKGVTNEKTDDYYITRDFMDVVFEVCYLVKLFKNRLTIEKNDPNSPFYNLVYTPCEEIPGMIPNVENMRKSFSKKAKDRKKKKNQVKGKGKGKWKQKQKDKNKRNSKNDGPFVFLKQNINKRMTKNGKKFSRLFEATGDRLGGPLGFINWASQYFTSGYPWQCSLRHSGYKGAHRCGVTLLSGPPKATILVGAAHCNYVCRNEMDQLLEMCCCGDNKLSGCKYKSSYCPGIPKLREARSNDMQIVCREHHIGQLPEHISWEEEIVLDIKEIKNHEEFMPGNPLDGNDIAVYIVDEEKSREKMKMKSPFQALLEWVLDVYYLPYIYTDGEGIININETAYLDYVYGDDFREYSKRKLLQSLGKMVLPACLPKKKYSIDGEEPDAIFSGWKDPKPSYLGLSSDIKNFDLFGKPVDKPNPAEEIEAPLEDITAYFNKFGAEQSSIDVWPHHARMKKENCDDPAWMKRTNIEGVKPSNTSYPAGTTCYKDPSSQSCMLFGSSGSGLVRPFDVKSASACDFTVDHYGHTHPILDFLAYNYVQEEGVDICSQEEFKYDTTRVGYVGPLSLYKGCDRAANVNYEDVIVKGAGVINEENDQTFFEPTNIDFTDTSTAELDPQKWLMLYGGDNPAVFTDAYCYLGWIANQYDMDPPDGWEKPDYCLKSSGDPSDKEQEKCNSLQNSECDFTGNKTLHVKVGAFDTEINMDKCYLLDVGGGYADNINVCVNKKGQLDHCANNCKGVDANAVVAGGIGALVVGTSALTSLLAQAVVVAPVVVGVPAAGGAMMFLDQMRRRRRCPPTRPCKDRVTGRCCRGFIRGGRRRCSRRC